jgi:hypothetical protein
LVKEESSEIGRQATVVRAETGKFASPLVSRERPQTIGSGGDFTSRY